MRNERYNEEKAYAGSSDVDYEEFKDRVSSMAKRPELAGKLMSFTRKYPYYWAKYQKEAKNKR